MRRTKTQKEKHEREEAACRTTFGHVTKIGKLPKTF